ncbi:MAG: hypothetical protein SPH94_03705 [Fusobacterium necrophorum]|nr:hypothetical protein [Fusobacterium necrophorum]
MNKNLKKGISAILLLGMLLTTGCTNSSELVKNQNQEIVELQKVRNQILARPAVTPKEKLAKKADLNLVNKQIEAAMKTAQQAQQMSNDQTANNVAGAVTAVGAVLGTAAVIHSITK